MTSNKRYELTIPFSTKIFNTFRKIFIATGLDRLIARYSGGKKLDSFIVKLIPPNYLYKNPAVRKRKVNGIWYELDISDTMDHGVYYDLADSGQSYLFQLVKPGTTVFDIGANIGSTMLNFARLTGPAGKVYSFEPDQFNYKKASRNLSLNSFSNVQLNNIGLGAAEEDVFLYNVNEKNRGMLRILKDDSDNKYEKTLIHITTLEKFLEKEKVNTIDLIKIDVEGFEKNVLKGSESVLLKFHPVLFIELDDNNLKDQGSSAADVIGYIRKLGYQHIRNAANGERLTDKYDYTNCHFDIVCTVADK
jgi:FkbM family methyltransferase